MSRESSSAAHAGHACDFMAVPPSTTTASSMHNSSYYYSCAAATTMALVPPQKTPIPPAPLNGGHFSGTATARKRSWANVAVDPTEAAFVRKLRRDNPDSPAELASQRVSGPRPGNNELEADDGSPVAVTDVKLATTNTISFMTASNKMTR